MADMFGAAVDDMGHSGKAGENIFWAMNRNKPGIIKRILNALERFIARIRGKDAYLAVEQRQAAERLRDMLTGELKRAYGADVKGEAAVESGGGKRHSLAGANSRTADLNSLGGAYQMYQNGVSMDTIRKRTGWWLGKDGKWRYEISDKEMRFNPEGYVDNPQTVGDYVKHDRLFAAYPWIADIPVYVSDVVGGDPSSLGRYIPSEKIIEIKAGITSEKARTVLAHELQHVIQNTEHFASGTNTVVATRYLINLAYDLVKNNPEFVAKKKPQDKMDYIIDYIEAKDNTTLDEYARYYYFRNHGETEARNTAKRLDMTDAERKAIPVVNDGDVYTRESVRSEFIDNLREMGYNKKQIDTIMKEGVSYDNKSEDEQKSLGQVGKRGGNLGRTIDGLLSQNLQRGTQREVHGNGEVQEADSAEKAGQIGSVSGGVSRRTDSGASGLGEAGKRLNEVSKPEKRFSLSSNVEQTKDLIAVHNMTAAELEKSLDLGGLPMPSIAIIKAADGHSEYGDVSLVFGKDTIDPKKSVRNKVYGGDAWTPEFPEIDYKANEKVGKRIRDKYYDLSKKFGNDNTRALYNYAQDLSDVLTSEGGEKAMIGKLYGDTGMMQIYLMDTGRERVANVNKETKTALTDGQVRQYENLIDTLGRDKMDGYAKKPGDNFGDLTAWRRAFVKENEAGIRKAFEKTFIEDGMSAKDAAEVSAELALSDLRKYVLDTFNYIKNGVETVKTEFDSEATNAAIKKAADGEGYRKWVNDLFGGAEEKSGIRNSKDAYTASGNRRSFEALHWENNLENIVKAMLEQDETGGAFFSGMGIWGVSAKKYNSISEIKNDSSRLRTMNEAEYNALKEQYGARMQEIAQTLIDPKNDNYFIASDDAYSLIVDAVRNSKDESGILRYLKKYNSRATEKTASDIAALVRDIAEMPTGYFEAKPQRAVGFDEVKAVILPDNASGELVSRLESDGINTVTYKAGDENSRLEALNGVENVRFSLARANDEYMKAVESGNVEEQQRLVDEAAENAGYDTVLYHGTQSFGFTQIDVSKYSDDGISFFATSNPEMAQTYSAKSGTREISRKSGIENLSLPQVVDRLNAVAAADTSDYDRYTYRIMNRSDTEALKKSIQSGIKELRVETERLISEYADRLAKDFNGEDELKHSRLRSLLNALDSDSASKLSANLYTVLNHNEIFDDAAKVKFGNLEADIRLLKKLAALKTDEDVVVREDTDRYDIVVEDQEKARNRLEKLDNSGNYVLRGRTEGFLEIDGNGHNWNAIFTTLEPKGGNTLKAEYDFGSESLKLSDRDGEFAVIPAKSVADAVYPMARAFARRYGTTFATTVLAQTKDQLKNSATAEVKIKSTGKTNTRDIANFAREQGYPGVKITDIYDNGGRGSEAGRGDVYIFFNPEQDVKSADPITYDNDGNVIPLSERFNSKNNDIRYSLTRANNEYMKAVESGDTEEQRRLVDEAAKANGYDRLFWHGSKKGGGFTEFRDWSYFTENKKYASRYAKPGDNSSLYEVYANLGNAFDTRKPECREIFDKMRSEYGLSKVQESGLPDWTDGYDIAEFIDENGLDYDSIILDEGGNLVDGKPVSRGFSYVIRSSEQVKSADPITYDDSGNVIPLTERFDNGNRDIRWSLAGKYDYSKSFADQIDDYKNGLLPVYDTFVVSETPKVWQDIGFNALPVTLNQTHVDYALNGTKDADHEISEADLKKLPEKIKEPIAIIQPQSKPSRAVVFIEMISKSKKNIVVPVEVDGYGKTNNLRIDSNALASLFGKNNAAKQLKDAIDNTVNGKTELFYWDKNRSLALLQGAGLQLPSGLPQDGFVRSIHEPGSFVKTKIDDVTNSLQFKRWFGDWKGGKRNVSKVVNRDGSLVRIKRRSIQSSEVSTTLVPHYRKNASVGIFLKFRDVDRHGAEIHRIR